MGFNSLVFQTVSLILVGNVVVEGQLNFAQGNTPLVSQDNRFRQPGVFYYDYAGLSPPLADPAPPFTNYNTNPFHTATSTAPIKNHEKVYPIPEEPSSLVKHVGDLETSAAFSQIIIGPHSERFAGVPSATLWWPPFHDRYNWPIRRRYHNRHGYRPKHGWNDWKG